MTGKLWAQWQKKLLSLKWEGEKMQWDYSQGKSKPPFCGQLGSLHVEKTGCLISFQDGLGSENWFTPSSYWEAYLFSIIGIEMKYFLNLSPTRLSQRTKNHFDSSCMWVITAPFQNCEERETVCKTRGGPFILHIHDKCSGKTVGLLRTSWDAGRIHCGEVIENIGIVLRQHWLIIFCVLVLQSL